MYKNAKDYIFFVVFYVLAFVQIAGASEDVTQQKLTSMDYFLDKLQSHVSCDSETKTKYRLCIRTIQFVKETGKILMNVEISPNSPIFQDMAKRNVKNKDKVLLSAISTILDALGLDEPRDADSVSEEIGIIQGLEFSISNAQAIKDYVVQNTVLDAFLKTEDTVYWVKRGKNGDLKLIKLLEKKE